MSTVSVNASPLRPLQAAVWQRLSAALGVPVYDGRAPEGHPEESAPYVVIGEAVSTRSDTHQTFGHDTVASVHVWSRMREFSEANQIASDAVAALDRQALDLGEGWHTVGVWHEHTQPAPDPDPDVRHVVLRFRVRTEHRPE